MLDRKTCELLAAAYPEVQGHTPREFDVYWLVEAAFLLPRNLSEIPPDLMAQFTGLLDEWNAEQHPGLAEWEDGTGPKPQPLSLQEALDSEWQIARTGGTEFLPSRPFVLCQYPWQPNLMLRWFDGTTDEENGWVIDDTSEPIRHIPGLIGLRFERPLDLWYKWPKVHVGPPAVWCPRLGDLLALVGERGVALVRELEPAKWTFGYLLAWDAGVDGAGYHDTPEAALAAWLLQRKGAGGGTGGGVAQ